jgi:hypothetical protein
MLEVKKGDVIVLRYAGLLTPSHRNEIQARVERAFPDQVVLILDNGAEIDEVSIK